MSKKVRAFLIIVIAMSTGCGSSNGGGQSYPLVTPPVKAATPAGFGGTANVELSLQNYFSMTPSPFHGRSLSPSDFKSRFFQSGPTNIFGILASIDSRIAGYNSSSSTAPCLTQAAVAYTISAFGQSITMYAQCAQIISGGSGFIQWAVQGGAFYLYTAIGAGWTAAIATPITGSSQYSVQAWSSVGIIPSGTSWDDGSYGVIQILANPVTANLEMSVAGIGMGYCGAQYKSDGTNIYGTGSVDMGATCNATDTICVLASDALTTATCTAAEETFGLPAMGRAAATGVVQPTWGASAYPGGSLDTIILNGTSTDSIHFGPSAPTVGAGSYQ